MRAYDVSCYRTDNGQMVWGMTREAESPIEAIAQACLSPSDESEFIRRMHADGLDELEDVLTVTHPAQDMDGFEVRAEVVP